MIRGLLSQKDRVGSLILLVIAMAFFSLSTLVEVNENNTGGFTSKTFPMVLAGVLALCSLVQLLRPSVSPFDREMSRWQWRQVLYLIGLMAVYALAFPYLGFVVGSCLFLVLGFRALGETNLVLSIAVAVGLVGAIWLLLTQVFGLYLEPGELFQ